MNASILAGRAVDGRRQLLAGAVGLVAVLVALGGALGPIGAQEATPAASTPGVQGEAATIDCDPNATDTAATSFTIVSEESAARYRAQEELASVGATEAVGETSAIIGQLLFGEDGLPLACSRFDVDLRTLQSDEARRDNFLYTNTLETERYPLATFVLTEVVGLDGPLAEGEETALTLIGNLTIHGVTKLVAWEATATLDGDTLRGSAATNFEMPDFDIEPPVVGPVVSLDETVRLEVDLTAERAAGEHVPVVFLTARDDPADLRAGFTGEGDDYLTKPFSLEELLLRIEAVLRRSWDRRAEPTRLVCGDLVLDEDAHRVWRGEAEIALSPTEFRLLRYLMLNRDRVVSKSQILDHVWDYEYGGEPSAVETYVSYLRRKLDDRHGRLIRTVRGFGYALRTPEAGPAGI